MVVVVVEANLHIILALGPTPHLLHTHAGDTFSNEHMLCTGARKVPCKHAYKHVHFAQVVPAPQ